MIGPISKYKIKKIKIHGIHHSLSSLSTCKPIFFHIYTPPLGPHNHSQTHLKLSGRLPLQALFSVFLIFEYLIGGVPPSGPTLVLPHLLNLS